MQNQKLDFENMGIYDLRNYARSIGVLSPTKLRRDELIAKITAIIMGEEPEKKKTNKGRPPKHKVDLNTKLDYILPNNLFDNTNLQYQQYVNQINKTVKENCFCENNKVATSAILFEGYYKPFDANYGFVLQKGYLSKYYKENVIILNELATEYNLQEGDFVTGGSMYLKDKNLMLATSVNFINNLSVNDIIQNTEIKYEAPTKKINLDTDTLIDYTIVDKLCPMVKGTRILLEFEDKDSIKNNIIAISKSLIEQNNTNVFLFTIDDLPEDIFDILHQCPEINLVNYGLDMDRQNYVEAANLKIKHILRLVNAGQDVALICYNTNNYKNNLANYAVINENINIDASMLYAQNKIKDMFCLAQSTTNGSLTTIFVNDKASNLLDICNTYIYFKSDKLPETDITVDILSSYTRNIKNVLSDSQYIKYKQFKTDLTYQNLLQKLELLFEDKN